MVSLPISDKWVMYTYEWKLLSFRIITNNAFITSLSFHSQKIQEKIFFIINVFKFTMKLPATKKKKVLMTIPWKQICKQVALKIFRKLLWPINKFPFEQIKKKCDGFSGYASALNTRFNVKDVVQKKVSIQITTQSCANVSFGKLKKKFEEKWHRWSFTMQPFRHR